VQPAARVGTSHAQSNVIAPLRAGTLFVIMRRIALLVLLLAALLVLWTRSRQTPPTRRSVSMPMPGVVVLENAESLRPQVLRDGHVDEAALAAIAREGSANKAGAAYYIAARNEYDHARYADGIPYAQRAVLLVPAEPGVHMLAAALMLNSNDARGAVEESERAAQLNPNSAEAFRILGYACYADRQYARAAEAWEASLKLRNDGTVADALARLRRENTVESTFAETTDGRFDIRSEQGRLSPELRDQMFTVLERAFSDIARDLNVAPSGHITVTLYTQQQFRDVTHAPTWSGAVNDGTLRIPIGDVQSVTPQLEAALRHELTHWFVRAIAPRCPVWLNEGIAQLEEPRRTTSFSPELETQLRSAPEPFANLEGSFMSRGDDAARVAYMQSLIATEHLRDKYGWEGLRAILARSANGEGSESALRAVSGEGYAELERVVQQSVTP